jgi:hypothetical protein
MLHYEILDHRVKGPDTGYLYAVSNYRDDLYFVNGALKHVATGVQLTIPDGVTVEIEGVYAFECKGLHLIPQRFVGPCTIIPQLALHNRASVTLHIPAFTALATVRAIATPLVRSWTRLEPEPEPEQEPEQAQEQEPEQAQEQEPEQPRRVRAKG